ncbi:MAG: histidine phosphatase family protein [Sphingomonas bacterium]|jgi:phosphohistidine phosphatase|nr:histidine phosphatase family protein [Sphingomonas bacterium]MDB5690811.1 histidine phosphatase family protein [Sphingomonas bacterium]
MKRLTLLRHAKSGWDDPVARDFDRPLNAKGKRAARAIGRHLREAGLAFDHAIASPATRVVETLEEMSGGLGRALRPAFDRKIYLASAETLLDVIHNAPETAETLLVAGHNPGLEDLVLLLVPDGAGQDREAVEDKFPTASLAEIRFDAMRWADVRAGAGTLSRFVRPRDLDPTLGPEAR